MLRTLLAIVLLLTSTISSAKAVDDALQTALDAAVRSSEDKARDSSRKPAETLAFFEVKANSKVLELMPGGGWYTKILGTYLKDSGELYVAIGANAEQLKLAERGLGHVTIIGQKISMSATTDSGIYDATGDDFEVSELDVALTFRNMHNLSESARTVINSAVFAALKPGGVYGVIDHTKRHMQADSKELWRREDPVQVIKELQAVGFIFEDYSTLHAQPQDALILDSTHESIKRNSDRFSLRFRKPG